MNNPMNNKQPEKQERPGPDFLGNKQEKALRKALGDERYEWLAEEVKRREDD